MTYFYDSGVEQYVKIGVLVGKGTFIISNGTLFDVDRLSSVGMLKEK